MSERETKMLITEKAFQLFLNNGYKQTSINDLVAATELSKGAIYHYFKSKEQIYEEVIETYILSYYRQVDWDNLKDLNIDELEERIAEFYKYFVPKILSITQKGMSRYFILFFEALEIQPSFKDEIQKFYTQLRKLLSKEIKKSGSKNADYEALLKIAKFEGMLFYTAVFPEQKIPKTL